MKPDAAGGVRGEFRPIPTDVPGMHVCELLPRHAEWMNQSAIVRTVNHKAGCHNPMLRLTGYPELLPSIGMRRIHLPPSIRSACEYMNQDDANPVIFADTDGDDRQDIIPC